MSALDRERVMRDLAAMGQMERYQALLGEPTLRERLYSRRFVLAAVAAAASIAALAFLIARHPGPETRLETAVAEVREVSLPDGSRVTLGAKSRLSYVFTADERRLALAGGEAYFSVTADPRRPFTVMSGDMKVTVLGTEFEIHRRASGVRVAVADGMVQVSRAHVESRSAATHPTEKTQVLHRGESVMMAADSVADAPTPVHAEAIGTWRDGRLLYENVALRDVVEDANRYFSGGITLADPALGDIRVTTSFRTSQVEGMIDTLRASLPLDVEHRSDGSILLKPRREYRAP